MPYDTLIQLQKIYLETQNIIQKILPYSYDHQSTVYNSFNLETTQEPENKWVDKETVADVYNFWEKWIYKIAYSWMDMRVVFSVNNSQRRRT